MADYGRELSIACLDDRCDWCDDPACTCRCHRWQEYDLLQGWIDVEDGGEDW